MKTAIYLLFVIMLLATTSCEVDVPETDTTPPTFSFHIEGDGFEHTFTQDDDFESFQLNIRSGTEYEFYYIGSDIGGLQTLIWNYDITGTYWLDFNLPDGIPDGWRWTDERDGGLFDGPFDIYRSDGVRYEGDSSAPFSTAVLSGKFTPWHLDQVGIDHPEIFHFIARDYGGLSGEVNVIEKRLHVLIGHYGSITELVPRE